jgi:HK97 family phage portal protein
VSLLSRRGLGDTANQLIPPRTRTYGTTAVSADSALRSSAVWACLQLRGDLISTLPLDSYRLSGGLQVEMPLTPFLKNPANDRFGRIDWLFASQVDLDRSGNAFGIIQARDGLGNPAVVELVPTSAVSLKGRGAQITEYRIGGTTYDPRDVWHERQFVVAGVPLGLSRIAYSAMSIGGYLSAQQFALDWFGNGTIPSGRLKNTAKTINKAESQVARDNFRDAVANRELFVHGADWEYEMLQVAANESQFLETMNYGVADIARFFGVPGDLIDAETNSRAKITYANITQRHLGFLVMHLNPAVVRREYALSAALPAPRFVKFNTDALLRMDPSSRTSMLNSQVEARTLAPSEARALENRLPFTESQMAEFDRLFGKDTATPAAATPTEGNS